MSDRCFHFSFAIGILNPAGHGHDTVVRKHIPKKWVESGIVNVRSEHALAQIVEHYNAHAATQSAKRFLMEFGPDA